MLVVMAAAVKSMGDRLPSFELLFFRSGIGLLFDIPAYRSIYRSTCFYGKIR
jgi:hypothetical protein